MASENRDVLFIAVQQIFRLWLSEVPLLLALVQHSQMSKKRTDMAEKTVDVHICRMRKQLKPFEVDIKTLWGYGYQMTMANRRRTMDIILQRVAAAPTL